MGRFRSTYLYNFGLNLLVCAVGITVSLTAADASGGAKPRASVNPTHAAAAQRGRPDYATCGWAGVRARPITKPVAQSLGMAVPYGAIFAKPQPDSPAAAAGIEADDVVTSVNGVPLGHARDFAKLMSKMAPGSRVELNTRRAGQLIVVRLTVGSAKCHSPAANA